MEYVKRSIKLLRKAGIAYLGQKSSDSPRPYEAELALIKGSHNNDNSHPSIIHFSFNKAATQYVKSILIKCSLANGLTPVCFNDYAFNSHFPFLDHLSATEIQKYIHVFRKTGYLYTVFGGMVEGIPELDKYKVILAVRDPRDMLVSGYYSQAFSHGAPSKSGDKYHYFMEGRKKAISSTIDQYALAESTNIYSRYIKYNDLLLEADLNVLILKYELMVHDFRSWLEDVIEYCELDLGNELIDSLATENARLRTCREDIYTHLRKGTPGDYKEKLHPETIAELNNRLHIMLEKFGYD